MVFIDPSIQGLSNFEQIALAMGKLVTEKNKAYGDSYSRSGQLLELLYPKGVSIAQYQDMLFIIRVIDKLFRIATDRDAFDEDPFKDIGGYAILAVEARRDKNKTTN